MSAKEFTRIMSYTKCIKCGRTIAVTKQFETETEYAYETENDECRYIDKWGYARNFCKSCMR